MEKYKSYELHEFLLDEDFKGWVASGAYFPNSIWEKLLTIFPEKTDTLYEAIAILKDWKKLPSQITDTEVSDNIQSILESVSREQTLLSTVWLWKKWLAYAAVFLLAMSSLLYFINSSNSDVEQVAYTDQINIYNELSALQTVALPDGSQIDLYPGSSITYAKNFTADTIRRIVLEGEAFFNVKRDNLKPFVVASGKIMTRVLGTSFNIRNKSDEISVSVATGKVSVFKSDQLSSNITLTANQKVIYNAHAQTLEKVLVENPILIQRENAKHGYAFNDESAINVLKSLEKDYGISIRFKEQELKNCFVTIPFRDEPFYQKLDILCRTINATYRTVENEVVIESKGCENIDF
jgi:transmembrane sensor